MRAGRQVEEMKKETDIFTAESAIITDMEVLCHNSIDLIRYARGLAVQHVNINA